MEEAKPRSRRRHSRDLKQRVLAECAMPGASVASVALAHGLNANLVHKWRRQVGSDGVTTAPVSFVALELPARTVSEAIELELQRGAVSVRVRWPLSSAAACAAWLREIWR